MHLQKNCGTESTHTIFISVGFGTLRKHKMSVMNVIHFIIIINLLPQYKVDRKMKRYGQNAMWGQNEFSWIFVLNLHTFLHLLRKFYNKIWLWSDSALTFYIHNYYVWNTESSHMSDKLTLCWHSVPVVDFLSPVINGRTDTSSYSPVPAPDFFIWLPKISSEGFVDRKGLCPSVRWVWIPVTARLFSFQ